MNKDTDILAEYADTNAAANHLGAAIEYATGGRYDVAVFHLEDAKKILERLRDKKKE